MDRREQIELEPLAPGFDVRRLETARGRPPCIGYEDIDVLETLGRGVDEPADVLLLRDVGRNREHVTLR